MKFLSIALFLSIFFELFFLKSNKSEMKKGVYILTAEVKSHIPNGKSLKFPNDSIFIDNEFAIEKVIRIDQKDSMDIIEIKQSLDRYHFIDLKKGLYKDIGKNLDADLKNIPWVDLNKKELSFNIRQKWENSEIYKIKDTVYEGIKVKKIEYISNTNKTYEILLQKNLAKNVDYVFFSGIEDKYQGEVLKIKLTYPDGWNTTYTKKFIPIKNHEVLNALEKLKLK